MADFARAEVAHLLRRSGFASPKAKVDALMGQPSWAAVVDRVLDTSANPPDTIPAAVDDRDPQRERVPALIAAGHHWFDRMATTPTPIVEKTAFFWHGVLTSAVFDPLPRLVFRQVQKWRALGLGDVHALLQAMAIDPAMLKYLDNGTNVKASPNENFARELMELFTMGNGTFTEADVVAMARAWTGHNYRGSTESYVFRPAQHDAGSKTLFGITRAWDGPQTITEIVRGSKQAVCARYLAGRLWSFFAYPNPAPDLLDEMADALIDVDMDVKAFLRIVFLRPEFRAATTRTALVRSPTEWIVNAMVGSGRTAAQLRPERWVQQLGQVIFMPPNVSGWRQNKAWISSSAQWAKASMAIELASQLESAGTFASSVGLSPAALVQLMCDRFGIDEPTPTTRSRLEQLVSAERAAGRSATAPAYLAGVTLLTPDAQLA